MADAIRTNTLTVLGAAGYLAFLGLALLRVMGYSVSWELLSLVLLTSSTFLGVDFGIDIFPVGGNRQLGGGDDDNP